MPRMEILNTFVSILGLTLVAIYLWFLGAASQKALRLNFDGPVLFHRIAMGQIGFIIYFYIRSFASFLWLKRTGQLVPVYVLEPMLVALLVLYVPLVRSTRFRVIIRHIRSKLPVRYCGPSILLLLSAILVLRELPREVPMSTDSAQYTFWTKQVTLFGMVPYSQFAWGELHFDYPAGFAVLNHLWSAISGINAAGMIAIQTVLQSQLAWLLLAELAIRFFRFSPFTGRSPAYLQIFGVGLLAYYLILPVGYEKANYMNLGAGKSSSLLILALLLSLLERFAQQAERFGYWVLVVGIIAVLFLINPSLVLLPAILIMATVILYLARKDFKTWIYVPGRALAAAPLFSIVFLDPTYFQQFILGIMPHLPPYNSPAAASAPVMASVSQRFADYFTYRFFPDLWHLVPFDLLKPEVLLVMGFLLYSAGRKFREDIFLSRRFRWVSNNLLTLLLSALSLTIVLRLWLPASNAAGLLVHYLHRNAGQFLQLVCMMLIAAILIAAPWVKTLRLRTLTLALLVGLPLSILIPDRLYDTDLRRLFRNSVPADDLVIFSHAKHLYQNEQANYGKSPDLSAKTPRILILNQATQINNENWLFPIGAGNILPLQRGILPCVFYYFQGSADYSYESYLAHVALKLDRNWLAERGIVYVYVPSEMASESYPPWLTDYFKDSDHVVVKSGRAALLRL
jgi:hypothetical protein